jgi:hypothetical protein
MTAALLASAKDLLTQASAELDAVRLRLDELRAALDGMHFGPPIRKVAASWGDGVKDATSAIQMEIDALAVTGGVCEVPAGVYMVDAVKSITVRSGVTLKMDANAVLKVKPNSSPRYYAVRTEADSAVEGGTILGDRLAHTYTAGSPHEWGYGLMVGDRVKVTGTTVAECTGDGIGLSGDDAELREVKCLRNRRNGMSVFAAKRCKVIDSEFAFTGAMGSNPGAPEGPWAGVDIEPDGAGAGSPTPICEQIEFINCKFTDNQSAGIKSYKNSAAAVPAVIRNISVTGCELARNTDGAWFSYCDGLTISQCEIHDNQGYGINLTLTTTTGHPIEANTFYRNLLRLNTVTRTSTTATGFVTEYARDLKRQDSAGVCVAGVNTYR